MNISDPTPAGRLVSLRSNLNAKLENQVIQSDIAHNTNSTLQRQALNSTSVFQFITRLKSIYVPVWFSKTHLVWEADIILLSESAKLKWSELLYLVSLIGACPSKFFFFYLNLNQPSDCVIFAYDGIWRRLQALFKRGNNQIVADKQNLI